MASMGDLMVILGLDTSSYSKGMQKAEQQLSSFSKTTQTGMSATGTSFQKAETQATAFAQNVQAGLEKVKASILTTVAAIGAGFGLFEMAKSTAEYGDSIYDLSKKMDISGQEAAYMDAMFKQANVDSSIFVGAISRLDKGLLTAGKSGNTTTKALAEFNVQLLATDANGKTHLAKMPDQLKALADGYDRAAKAGNATAYVTALLGARGQDLIPLLADYAQYADVVNKIDFSGIDVDALHQEAQSMKVVELQTRLVGVAFGSALLPVVSTLAPMLLKGLQEIAKWFNANRAIITAFVIAITGLSVLTMVIQLIRWFVVGIQALKVAEWAAIAITWLRNSIVALTVAMEADPLTAIASLVVWVLLAIAAVSGLDYWLKKLAGDSNSAVASQMTTQMQNYNSQLDDALTSLNKMGASFDELYQISGALNLPDFGGGTDGTGGSGPSNGGSGSGGTGKTPPIAMPGPPPGWPDLWEKALEWIRTKLDGLKKWLQTPWPPLPAPALAPGWALILASLPVFRSAFSTAVEWAKQKIGEMQEAMKGWKWPNLNPMPMLQPVFSTAVAWVATELGKLKSLVPHIDWGAVWSGMQPGLASALAWCEGLWQNHKGLVIGVVAALAIAVVTILTGGLDALPALLAGAWEGITAGIAAIGPAAAGVVATVVGFFTELGPEIGTVFTEIVLGIEGWLNQIPEFVSGVVQEVVGAFQGLWSDISGIFSNILAGVHNVVSSVEGVFSFGGATAAVPGYASGTSSAPGGLAWVGEEGPELLNLPRGAGVTTMKDLPAISGGAGGLGTAGIDYDRLGQAVATALGPEFTAAVSSLNVIAKIDTSRQNLTNLNRAMTPINQSEAIRRGS